jgi:hypothetical protein
MRRVKRTPRPPKVTLQPTKGLFAHKRLILSHHKNLNRGHFLVDDRTKNGAELFEGQHIHFGTAAYPNWATVTAYLRSAASLEIQMILMDSAQDHERFSHFEYYLFGSSIPVCFKLDKQGHRYGALVPGDVSGSLEHDATRIFQFHTETHEFDEISEAEFINRVLTYVKPPPIRDLSPETMQKYKDYLVRQQLSTDSQGEE